MRWLRKLFKRSIVKLEPDEHAVVFLTVKDGEVKFDWEHFEEHQHEIGKALDRAGFGDRVVVVLLDGVDHLYTLKGIIAERPSGD